MNQFTTSFAEGRRWVILLVLVLASFGLNAFNLWRDWESTPLPLLAILTLLGFFLPVLAVFFLWRGHSAGAWILVIMFGIRGLGNLGFVVTYARHIFLDPIVIRHAILGAFFVVSAVWIAMATVRGFCPLAGFGRTMREIPAKLELAKNVIRKTRVGVSAFGIVDSSDLFPPRSILNDFLLGGSDAVDQNGMYKWEPFEVSPDDYDALKSWWLETHPKAIEDSLGATFWSEWLAEVLEGS